MTLPVAPHGGLGKLTERLVSADDAATLKRENANAPRIVVTDADLSTVRRLGDGALTPLEGPMTEEVFNKVLDEAKISVNGKDYAWGIPLSLPVTHEEAQTLEAGKNAVLVDESGEPIAVLEVEDIFFWDKSRYNKGVYGTERMDHPGARIALNDPRFTLVGGKIHVFPFSYGDDIVGQFVFSPKETREKLAKSGWEAAVAFQTRNPLHRAHEYAMVYGCEVLTKQGLKAGVVLNPLVGETKGDDVPASIRMESYKNLKDHKLIGKGDSDEEVWKKAGYDITDVFDLYALDIKMFYGGPREAVMHAVYRQNYGFSHIIIGRKHADAPYDNGENIWGDFDAQEIFTKLNGELEIKPVNVGFAAYYEELGRVGLIEVYKEKGWKPVTVAGRILREQLSSGDKPDPRIIREETSEILIEAYKKKGSSSGPQAAENLIWHHHSVSNDMRVSLNGHKGATLWFTGLSGSGKSTLANEVAAALHEKGIRTYVLDGDNIRQGLNKGLGFSAEDRKENIRRIGEVAKLFTDSAVVNLTAFISPYKEDRDLAREIQPDSFIEIYTEADLSVCEERDPKGLYKKARAGEIKGFTGIDAPYEEPDSPEVKVNTGTMSLKECVVKVISYLEENGIVSLQD